MPNDAWPNANVVRVGVSFCDLHLTAVSASKLEDLLHIGPTE